MELIRWAGFFTLNALMLYSWLLVYPRRDSIADRFLGGFILTVTQIIASTMALGLLFTQALTAVNLIVVNSLFSLGVFAVGAWGLGHPLAAPRLEIRAAARLLRQALASSSTLKILITLAIGALIVLLLFGLVFPPVEWDSLMYHLPAVAYYMQQQSLSDPALPMDSYSRFGIDGTVWVNAFPKNIELLFLWATIIPDSDALVDLVPFLFAILGAVAVYSLARRLGATPEWGIGAGSIWLLTPVVLAQSRSNLIDLCNSGLILAALALLYPPAPGRRLQTAVAGLAAGIVLGAKWSGILFLWWLALFVLSKPIFIDHPSPKRPWRAALINTLSFSVPAMLVGGYWYIKNWRLYDNPLWPFSLAPFGFKLFAGLVEKARILALTFPDQLDNTKWFEKLFISWREPIAFGFDADMRLGGLGPFWFALGLPAVAYLTYIAYRRRDLRLLSLLVVIAGMVFLHPESWWTRYTMFLAGLGAIAFVIIRSKIGRPETTRLLDIIAIASLVFSTGATFTSQPYLPSKIATLLKTPAELRTSAKVRPEIVSSAYDFVARKTAAGPAKIAYGSGLRFIYPLWGPRLQNNVSYIWSNNRHELDTPWDAQLQSAGIKFLVVARRSPEYRLLIKQSRYQQAFYDRKDGYVVYRLRKRIATAKTRGLAGSF